MEKIVIRWRTDATGSFSMNLSDFDGCETEADIERIIDDEIDADFRINASGYCRNQSEHCGENYGGSKAQREEEEKAS